MYYRSIYIVHVSKILHVHVWSIPVQEFKKNVVGIVYNEILISNIEKNTNENVLLDRVFETGTCITRKVAHSTTELFRPINIHDPSRPNYHFPTLTNFLPIKKTHNKHIITLSGLNDLTN